MIARTSHHHIVALDTTLQEIPDFDLGTASYSLVEHSRVQHGDIPDLIKNATIIIVSSPILDRSILSQDACPHLKLIVVTISGTDTIDLETCRQRGITVSNCSQANAIAVSEHAFGLYFAARRRIVQTHMKMQAGLWQDFRANINFMADLNGTLPLSCCQEVMGIVGYGAIGKRIAQIGELLGARVLVAERNGAESCRPGRQFFEDVLQRSSVIFLTLPRTSDSEGLISAAQLKLMRRDAVLINTSRGGIVDEVALIQALKQGTIAGAATDVFKQEPCGPQAGALFDLEEIHNLNLITTPHTAWLAQTMQIAQMAITKQNVEAWHAGNPRNVVS